jgi:hypothetical protein
MVHIEYGFVMTGAERHKPEDGHLDGYERVSLTYNELERLWAAYTARKGTQEGK